MSLAGGDIPETHAPGIKGPFSGEMPNKSTTWVVYEVWHDEKRDSQA